MIDEKKLINKLIIRREKLRYISIAALHNNMNYVDTVIDEINSIIDIINEQPKVGEWIPCSERLPENLEAVAVTWVNREPMHCYENIKDKPFVATAVRYRGKWFWWSATIKDYLGEYGKYMPCSIDEAIEITAWQPLPEPWEGEK